MSTTCGDKRRGRLKELLCLAETLGASKVELLDPEVIIVEDRLAMFCREPQCQFYGLAPSCPPHVAGPDGMRKMLKKSRYVVVVKIDVPSSILFSDQRRELMQLLHEIVAGVELAALEKGFGQSKGFAGGSCKDLFCHAYPHCQFLSKERRCRYPEISRSSMSGFGVNVARMIEVAGWEEGICMQENASEMGNMSWVAGMILVSG